MRMYADHLKKEKYPSKPEQSPVRRGRSTSSGSRPMYIAGNEIADSLAWAGAGETTTPTAPLTYLELFSKHKAKNKAIWMIPPVHPWYQSKCPGGSLVRSSSRRD
ncbi:uncharacterized protein TNCV_836491 [Trichonephila clavipes]|nr:uncharacterized protein TNCV_836491 [Trichonephila clavipes]